MRQYLNQQYDSFVAKYGQLNTDSVKKTFGADADFSLLQSLEDYDWLIPKVNATECSVERRLISKIA